MADLDTFEEGNYYEDASEVPTEAGEVADHDDWDEVITEDPDGSDSEQESSKEDGQEEEAGEEVDQDSQVNNLDEKEEGETKDEEKDDKGDEGDKEEDEGSEDSESDDTSAETDADFDAGKMVKAFAGNQALEIPENATFRQKVAGKNEIVTLQELRDNYSGKVHWERRFEEANEREAALNAKSEQFEQELDLISSHLMTTRKGIEEGLAGTGDIREAVNYLVDLMNIDVYDFNKALHEAVATDVYNLATMEEGAQRAWWAEKKNDHLVKKQENLNKQYSERQAQMESDQKLADLRQSHNLTEDQYSQGQAEMKQLGYEDASPEQIVKYIETKPFTHKASELLSPFQDRLSDDKFSQGIIDITNALKSGDMTEEEVQLFLDETFKVTKIVDTLNKKVPKSKKAPLEKSKRSDHVESFDDFDDDDIDQGSYY